MEIMPKKSRITSERKILLLLAVSGISLEACTMPALRYCVWHKATQKYFGIYTFSSAICLIGFAGINQGRIMDVGWGWICRIEF
jgi:hypothetical protein